MALLVLATTCGQVSAQEGRAVADRDTRSDLSGLPEGEGPWWPGRYGADDQIGSLNELTPERILAAMRLVRTGARLSLGRVIDENIPVFPGRYWRQTVDLSPHVTNLRRSASQGQGWGKEQLNWSLTAQPCSA